MLLALAATTALCVIDCREALWGVRAALHDGVALATVWRESHPIGTAGAFALCFGALSALSMPGCAVLALGAGAVFGPVWGTLLVCAASAGGAVLPFTLARRFGGGLRGRFGTAFETIDRGVAAAGARYLLLLRVAPVVPYTLVNPLMGLTPMRTWTFFWVSAVGMLAGSAAYALAGAGIGAWALPTHAG